MTKDRTPAQPGDQVPRDAVVGILNLIPVNTEDNVLHLLNALAGLAAGVASSTEPVVETGRA